LEKIREWFPRVKKKKLPRDQAEELAKKRPGNRQKLFKKVQTGGGGSIRKGEFRL